MRSTSSNSNDGPKPLSQWLVFGLLLLLPTLAGCHKNGLQKPAQRCVECALKKHDNTTDMVAAARRFGRLCDQGDAASCSVLGVMFEHGRGVQSDVLMARRLYRKACSNGNSRACVNLGKLYESGRKTRLDPEAATILYDLACRRGDGAGCYQVARMHHKQGETKRALVALRRSCQQKHAEACAGLGAIYEHGTGVKQSLWHAKSLFRRACVHGSQTACVRYERLMPRALARRSTKRPPAATR